MPSYKELYPDKWLTSEHLKGQVVTITISRVTLEPMYDSQTRRNENRLAASFKGRPIMLPLNKTNLKTLEKITGTDDYDQWVDVRVTLTPARAPNGKGTIVIGKAAPAPAPVHGPAQPAPVHGRAEEAPVHGRPVHGLPPDPNEVRDLDAPDDELVHGLLEPEDEGDYDPGEEEPSAEPDPKSVVADPKPSQQNGDGDTLFYSPADFQNLVKEAHAASTEPMTEAQHKYVARILGTMTGLPGETVLSELVGREVTLENPAGDQVGRLLYEVMRPGGGPIEQTEALREFGRRLHPPSK